MRRVLIVRYEGSPFDIRMSKVIEEMRDAGWECDVLVPAGGRGLAQNNVAGEFGRDLAGEVRWREFSVAGGAAARLRRVLTASRVFGTAEFESCLREAVRAERYDVVWVKESPCLPSVFRALACAGRPETPVVCDMYENSIEQQYDTQVRFGTPLTRTAAALRRLLPRLREAERLYLPRCDRVFVVIEEMKQHLVASYRVHPERIAVVHNVEKLAEFDGIERDRGLAPDDRTLVTYIGGAGVHRGLEELVAAAGLLAHDPDCLPVQVAIVGPGSRDAARLRGLGQAASASELLRVVERVPHRVLMQWVKQSGLGIVPHRDTGHIRTTIPNKLFQYMAAGVPVIVSDVGPLGRIVRETECGLTFRPGSAEDLAAQIKLALDRPEERQTWGANGRRGVEERYCWERERVAYREYLRPG